MNKALQTKIADYCFLSLFAVLPFVDILSPITLILTMVTGLMFKPQKNFLLRFKEKKGVFFLILFFVLSVCTLLYSSDISESLEKLSKISAFVLIPTAFVITNPSKELIRKAIRVFIYALIVFCIFSLLSLFYHLIVDYETSHWYNFVQDAMYHKYMPEDAMYLNTGLVFVLFGTFTKNFKLLVSFLFLVIIVLFGVRLGLFVYLLIAAIYFVLNFKELLSLKNLIIITLGIFASVMLVQQSRYANDKFFDTLEKIGFNTSDQVSEVGEEYHDISLRKKMWSSSAELIEKSPLIGYGTGVERNELEKVYVRRGYEIGRYNAHNQFLSILIQYGALGLFLFLLLFAYLFTFSIKEKKIKVFLVTVIMIISMITESYLEIQQGVFYFCTFVTLFVFQKANNKPIEN